MTTTRPPTPPPAELAPVLLRWATPTSWHRLRDRLDPRALRSLQDCLELAHSYGTPGAMHVTVEQGGSAGPSLVLSWEGVDAWQQCGAHCYLPLDEAHAAATTIRAWWRDRERP